MAFTGPEPGNFNLYRPAVIGAGTNTGGVQNLATPNGYTGYIITCFDIQTPAAGGGGIVYLQSSASGSVFWSWEPSGTDTEHSTYIGWQYFTPLDYLQVNVTVGTFHYRCSGLLVPETVYE